jgi:hypothetical protein
MAIDTAATHNITKNVHAPSSTTSQQAAQSNKSDFTQSQSKFGTNQISKQKYNELFHEVELYLDNSGSFEGKEDYRFHINPSSVLNLTISDTFNNWCAEGSLTFFYMPDDAPGENGTGQQSSTFIKGAKDNGTLMKSYQFRADGFDLLRVRMSPSVADEGVQSGSPFKIKKDDPKWWLSHVFSVFDYEDVGDIPEALGPAAFYMKCIKLYFRDVRYQILQSTNLEYSTARSSSYSPNFNTGLANEGCLKVGDALLDVWNTALGDPAFASEEFIQNAGDTWDPGENFIFYTSPANYSALDDIQYLASHYVASKKLKNSEIQDIGVLSSKRPDKPGLIPAITLTPISDFFEKATDGDSAGELQFEHFFVTSNSQDGASNKGSIKQNYRAPFSQSDDRDLKTAKYGQILNYSFVDMAPEINTGVFNNLPVYSVDIGSRKFRVQFQQNTVQQAKQLLADNYIAPLFKSKNSSNNKELFLPTLHKSKEQRNIFPIYTLNGDETEDGKITRQKSGIHQLLYTGLFQNACLTFKTLGLTLRQPGVFIALDKMEGCQDSDYNNKLYGQWFVIKVDHVFEAGSYVNIIYAIKIHRHQEKQLKFPNIATDE